VFDSSKNDMDENELKIAYTDKGKMEVQECLNGDSCSLIYGDKEVFTSKG